MKKFFMLLAAMFCLVTTNAQSISEQMATIDKLCVKLGKAIEKAPKPCGVGDVDTYVEACKVAGVGAVGTAGQLQDLYKRQIGETVDGVTDVTVKKPSLEDWVNLGAAIATQTAGAAKAGEAAADAAKAVKDAPKMKAIGMAKSVKLSGDILPVAGEALAEQAKAVNSIIETLKSGGNL